MADEARPIEIVTDEFLVDDRHKWATAAVGVLIRACVSRMPNVAKQRATWLRAYSTCSLSVRSSMRTERPLLDPL